MRATPENYKGIEYIQISSLPAEQKKAIYQSISHKSIINILKEDALLNDCLQYQHYVSWYETVFKSVAQDVQVNVPIPASTLILAFR